jgi:hypothetical protein
MSLSFIGIGAQKCASSWISNILSDHPEVAMSEVEPLDFFSYKFENGYRWYEKELPDPGSLRQIGEMSQSYFHEPSVIDRISAYSSDLKFIVSLRDPVERALSQHRHMVRLGVVPEDDLTFETALATNPTYVDQGRYFTHLSRWIEHFGSSRIHIILMEDIVSDPVGVAVGLYRFLGVDEHYRSEHLHQVSNASHVPKYRSLDQFIRTISRCLRAVGGEYAWQALGATGLKNAYHRFNRRPSSTVIPPAKPETLDRLRKTFAPEVTALCKLIGRDLSHWMPEI